MSSSVRPLRAVLVAAGAVLAVAAFALEPASAQTRSKSVQTEAEWVGFDATANTITVKVTKNRGGRPPKGLEVRGGEEAVFKVKPEGSVLTKTTVSINGQAGELTDIPEGKTVNVYWVADTADAKKRFARKVDVILSEEELEERYDSE